MSGEVAVRGQESDRRDVQARLAELARAEHARAAELHAIVGAIRDPIIVVSIEGAIVVANPAAEPAAARVWMRTPAPGSWRTSRARPSASIGSSRTSWR